MGFAANPAGTFGSMLGAISGSPKAPQAPQPAKIPDYAAFQDATQKATSKGSANTFLTGSSGIDPNLLRIGKQTLLGG